MNKIDSKKIDKLLHKISLNNNFSLEDTKNIINSQYEFIKNKIEELDFNTIKVEEDFKNIKTNFLLRHFGRLYTNFRMINKIKKVQENINNYHKKNGRRTN